MTSAVTGRMEIYVEDGRFVKPLEQLRGTEDRKVVRSVQEIQKQELDKTSAENHNFLQHLTGTFSEGRQNVLAKFNPGHLAKPGDLPPTMTETKMALCCLFSSHLL